jgi:uncharacterized heparinase superfamily protein
MSSGGRTDAMVAGRDEAPGRRLIKAPDDRGVSLTGRLGLRLHRWSLLTPFHALRLRGRAPLRLLAVPKDPVAGDKAAGEALLEGRFVHGGFKVPLEELSFDDPSLPPACFEHLHSFAWLRDLAAATTRERGVRQAESLMQAWLSAFASQPARPAWRADLWGRRILFWTAYAPYILSSREQDYRSAVLHTLARGARHLDRAADKAPAGIARLSAWAGVICAALVVQGGATRLKRGEAGMLRALGTGVHDDGGLVSRSPTEQVALVELLGQVRAAYLAMRREPPAEIAEALAGSASALLAILLGDGALISAQGGNPMQPRRVLAVLEGSGRDVRPLRQARGWGYQRLAARDTIVVMDAAPPPPSRALHGACASTLAFEFSDGPHRLIVNCGGDGLEKGTLPQSLAHALRSTAAHSTLTLGDRNSTAVLEDGGLGKGVSQVELGRDSAGGVEVVDAVHDGYVRRFGLLHQRRLTLSADGLTLEGDDVLLPAPKKKPGENNPFTLRFHLGRGVEVTSTADGQGALLRIRGGKAWQFRCRGGALAIEESLWVDGQARPHATQQLVVTGEAPADGITIGWTFKRSN